MLLQQHTHLATVARQITMDTPAHVKIWLPWKQDGYGFSDTAGKETGLQGIICDMIKFLQQFIMLCSVGENYVGRK